jgi:hypothetical protein
MEAPFVALTTECVGEARVGDWGFEIERPYNRLVKDVTDEITTPIYMYHEYIGIVFSFSMGLL